MKFSYWRGRVISLLNLQIAKADLIVGRMASSGAAFLFWSLTLSSTIANAQTSAFQCPEGGYAQSCKSYQELVQAKDPDVDANLVCFREYADEFFVINVGYVYDSTYTWYQLDHGYYTVRPRAKQSGTAFLYTFKNGIQDSAQNPYLVASGTWFALNSDLIFTGHEWNFHNTGKASKPDSQLDISSDQISLTKHYISQTNKVVDYSLTIQRSTKRFSETFNVAHDAKLGFETIGRCVEIKQLPKLPAPPPPPPTAEELEQKAQHQVFLKSLPQHWRHVKPGETCIAPCTLGSPVDVWFDGDALHESAMHTEATSRDGQPVKFVTSCTVRAGATETDPWTGECEYSIYWNNTTTPQCSVRTAEIVTTISRTEIAGKSQRLDYVPLHEIPGRCPLPSTEYIDWSYKPDTQGQ